MSENLKNEIKLYKSEEGFDKIMDWYDRVQNEITVDHYSVYADTRFGKTHIITAGDDKSKPVILIPGVAGCAPLWRNQINELSKKFKVFALDIVGQPGKSDPNPLSVFNDDLSLNIAKTINHAERIIDQGCHGVAIFGSTGQAQLISISEKISLLNELSKSKYREKYLIGTGLNSLNETINLMKVANSLNFSDFLIMPPAYYKYGDSEVIEFYSKVVEAVPDSKIILYNFEKLCGYKFSVECVKELVKKFPKQIVGVKDSSYNLYENLKIDNFSVMPGSELKLLKGLELGCDGIITATCNVTANLSRKV